MAKFSYNIDTGSVSYETILSAMQSSGADTHLLMFAPNSFYLGTGELDTIRRYLNAMPNLKLIIRVYSRNEGNWQNYPAANEYQKHWAWAKANLGDALTSRLIFDSPFNEPNLAGDNAAAAKPFVDYCIQLVKAASAAGIKLAVGAFSIGTPHESLLETVYAPLWQALAQYKQALSVHLYAAIPFEAGELAPLEIVLDAKNARQYISKGKWPMDTQGYYLARPFRIIRYCEKNNIPVPDIYVTETIVDNPFNSQTSWIKESWKSKYASTQYPDPRGIQTWEKYLKEMLPEMQFEDAVAYLLSHARKNIFYHPAFKALCLFALNANWGYPSGSNKEAGSNYADGQFSRFRQSLLASVNKDEIMPTYPLYDATIVSKSSSNIRDFPSATANIVKVLGTIGMTVKIAKEGVIADGYTWLEVQGADFKGYIAKTQNVVIDYAPTVPNEPIFEVVLYQYSLRGTAAEISKHKAVLEDVFATILDRFANPVRVE